MSFSLQHPCVGQRAHLIIDLDVRADVTEHFHALESFSRINAQFRTVNSNNYKNKDLTSCLSILVACESMAI